MDRRQHLGILLVVLLTLGLVAFAVLNVLRWHGGGTKQGDLALRRIALQDAPFAVQDVASKLAQSRAAMAIPQGSKTYVVIATGEMGERIDLARAERETSATGIAVHVRTSATGERLVVGVMNHTVTDVRTVRFLLDGLGYRIPAVINADDLPLVALPEKEALVLVYPLEGSRISGMLQVSGFARVPGGRLSVQVFSAGKGRILGEVSDVYAAAGEPDWGSFRVNVPMEVPAQTTDGVVVVYDRATGAKLVVPVQFGSK